MRHSRLTGDLARALARAVVAALACAALTAGCGRSGKVTLADSAEGTTEEVCPAGQTMCDAACVDLGKISRDHASLLELSDALHGRWSAQADLLAHLLERDLGVFLQLVDELQVDVIKLVGIVDEFH